MSAIRVASGSAILGGVQVFTRFLDLIVMLLLARLLTPADFGLVTVAISTLTIARACTDLPVLQALVQKETVDRADFDTVFTLSSLRGGLLFCILAILAAPLASMFDDERLVAILSVLAAAPLAAGLASPKLVGFAREVDFKPSALIEIIGKLAAFASSLVLAWATRSYWALIAGLVAAPVITMILSYVVAPYSPRFSLERVRALGAFAGWMSLSRAVTALNLQADRFFIGGMLGKPTLGQYALGSDLASAATYSFAAPIMQALFSGFSRIRDQHERLVAAYMKGQRLLVALVLPIGVGVGTLATPLVDLLIGPEWSGAAFAIQWLAPLIAFQMMIVAAHSLALALGRPRFVFERDLLSLFIRLPATLAAAYLYGLQGAVVARSLTGLLIILINLKLIHHLIGLTVWEQLRNCLRSVLSAAVLAASVYSASWWLIADHTSLAHQVAVLSSLIAIGAFAYVASHLALWLLMGRPEGPETFLLSLSRLLAGKILART